MEIGAFIGVVGWIAALCFSILYAGNSLMLYVDGPSIMCTIGGSYFSLMLQYGLRDAVTIFSIMGRAFRKYRPQTPGLIQKMQELSEKARREGLLALEEVVEEVDDAFMRNGLKLVVDGTDAEVIRGLMENEITGMNDRHTYWARMLDSWAKLAPGFGMLGTVLGLIGMLKKLTDKNSVGPNMAVALITTFYGAIMANALFNPILGRLQYYDQLETTYKEIILEGVLSIQAGDNPRILTMKLLSYLEPHERARVEAELIRD